MPMDGCSISDALADIWVSRLREVVKVFSRGGLLPVGQSERVDVVNGPVISAADKETIAA